MFQNTAFIGHFPYAGLFVLLVLGGIGLQVLRKDITRTGHAAVFILVTALVIYLSYRFFRSGGKTS